MSLPRRLVALVRQPPGRARAWFNVVFCGVLCLGLPTVLFLQTRPVVLAYLLAIGGLIAAVAMEVHFVRALRQARTTLP